MSRDDLQPTDETTIRSDGEEPWDVGSGQTPDEKHSRPTSAPPLADIADIRATLDQLEIQIAEYRRLLAADVAQPRPIEEVDAEELGNVAEEIAAGAAAMFDVQEVPVAESPTPEETTGVSKEATVAIVPPVVGAVDEDTAAVEVDTVEPEEPESLAQPEVDLPELYSELESQLEMGLHETASVSIFVDGEGLLNYLSSKSGSGVTPEPHPLFRAFSSGKAMAGATIWRLLDAGALEIDAPVANYWPEFAQRGKSKVSVRHVLTHTAGLPRDFGRADVDWGDWGRMSDILASMPLEYDPGEVIHYHAITFGILVAEIASRSTGLPFVDLFEREVSSPLDLEDTQFAIEYGDTATRMRVKDLHVPNGYRDPEMPEKMDWLLDNQIVSPGASCITSARDLARLYSTVCGGGVTPEGERWLSEAAAANVFAVHASAYEIESMSKSRVGQGVWMYDDQPNRMAATVESNTFGHGGMGTCIAWGDPEHNVGVAIVTDTMQDEELNGRRLNRVSAAIRRDLGLPVGSLAEL